MVQYYGFSTQDACKPKTTNAIPGADGGFGGIRQPINTGVKFTIVDTQLVLQDFVNALNIRRGTKVGQPNYGTILWDLLFEPNDATTVTQIENEIRRIADQDPRILLNNVVPYLSDSGILFEIEMAVVPFNQAQLIAVFASRQTGVASIT